MHLQEIVNILMGVLSKVAVATQKMRLILLLIFVTSATPRESKLKKTYIYYKILKFACY